LTLKFLGVRCIISKRDDLAGGIKTEHQERTFLLFDIVKKGFARLARAEKSDELFVETLTDIPPDIDG